MRSRRNAGRRAGKLRAGLPWCSANTSRRPQGLSNASARWRQSLKSPATITGASAGQGVQALGEQLQLRVAVAFAQAQVHANGMHFLAVAGQAQHAMQEPAVLMAADGHVEVVVADDLELRQQRIAVIARRVHRIAAIGELRPQAVGEEFVLRHRRPVGVAPGMLFVGAVDFLQKHHIGRHAAHRFTQFRQDEAPVRAR